jgi:hypothetical protein
MRSWVRWSACLCLSLLLWTAAAESTHNHPSQSENAACAICLAAHTASPAPISADTTPVFAAIGLTQEKEVVAKARLDFSDLGIRGPPVL